MTAGMPLETPPEATSRSVFPSSARATHGTTWIVSVGVRRVAVGSPTKT